MREIKLERKVTERRKNRTKSQNEEGVRERNRKELTKQDMIYE